MLTPFILFFGLTVATAVIAYWSDNLGKKLGKKRVSLFGLRPRDTATLLTIASSWGIMLATIIVLLVAFPPLRSALFRYDQERLKNQELVQASKKLGEETQQLKEERKNLIGERKALSEANQALAKKNRRAGQALNIASANVTKAEAASRKASRAEQTAQTRRRQAEKRADVARKNEENARQGERLAVGQTLKARENLRLANASLGETRSRLNATRGRLENTQKNLQAAQNRLGIAQLRLTQAKVRLAQVEGKLKNTQGKLKETQKSTEVAYKQLTSAFVEIADAKQQVITIKRERDELQEQTDALVVKYNQLYSEATALEQQFDALGHQFDLVTTANIRITRDLTLASRDLDTSKAPSQIEAALRELLREGQSVVAAQIPDASLALSSLVLRRDQRVTVLGPQQVMDGLVDYISHKNGRVSVRLLADRNFSASEKDVTGHFVVVEIQPVLDEGVTIVEGDVDGSLSDAKVFRWLNNLADQGRDLAADKGINPPVSPSQPFYVAETGERIFEALRQIRQIDGPAHVKIVSTAPISTVDPLQVRFVVEARKP